MLPNFVVIGAPKCGTTSLESYLELHPEIHMSAFKEPRFFADPDPRFPFTAPDISDREEYEALFESDAPRRGECSPSYSQYPLRLNTPQRIHELIPDARIIYLVGDPIHRTVSHYVQRVAVEGERRSLTEALGDNLTDPFNIYICASRYATQLEQYLQVFPENQILVVDQAELRESRNATLREVFRFLDVSPDFYSPAFTVESNLTSNHRRLPYIYLAARRTAVKRIVDVLPAPLRRPMIATTRRLTAKPIDRPAVDEETHNRLRNALEDEVRRLRLLTGKQFASWSL